MGGLQQDEDTTRISMVNIKLRNFAKTARYRPNISGIEGKALGTGPGIDSQIFKKPCV